jgi:hypothetical protein
MSLAEIGVLLKANNKNIFEKERLGCFFYLISQGNKISSPKDICTFEWEKSKKEVKKLSKEGLIQKSQRAKKWLGRTKQV